MLIGDTSDLLPLQVACLEAQLQQIVQEWSQLEQSLAADRALLAEGWAQTARVQALLDRPGSSDQQVRNALRELLVIGHVQRFLLEQSMQRGASKRARLQDERDQMHQAIVTLYQDDGPDTLI